MSVKTFLSTTRLLVMVTRRPVMAVWENSQSWIVISGNKNGQRLEKTDVNIPFILFWSDLVNFW